MTQSDNNCILIVSFIHLLLLCTWVCDAYVRGLGVYIMADTWDQFSPTAMGPRGWIQGTSLSSKYFYSESSSWLRNHIFLNLKLGEMLRKRISSHFGFNSAEVPWLMDLLLLKWNEKLRKTVLPLLSRGRKAVGTCCLVLGICIVFKPVLFPHVGDVICAYHQKTNDWVVRRAVLGTTTIATVLTDLPLH